MRRSMQANRLISNTRCMDFPTLIRTRMHGKRARFGKIPLKMSLNIYQHLLNAEKLRVSHDTDADIVQNGTKRASNLQAAGM